MATSSTPDIFGYNREKPTSVFAADRAMLTVADSGGPGWLIQNWNLTYSQEIQEIYEIGSANVYWVRGYPTGGGAIGRIIGAKYSDTQDILLFKDSAYDLCGGGLNNAVIKLKTGICGGTDANAKTIQLDLGAIAVTSVGFGITAGDFKVTEDLRFRFSKLALTATGDSTSGSSAKAGRTVADSRNKKTTQWL